jgi:hypothetical protein
LREKESREGSEDRSGNNIPHIFVVHFYVIKIYLQVPMPVPMRKVISEA